MVPHSLVVASDRQFDLALKVLTLIVSGAIAMSLLYILITIRGPRAAPDRGDVGPPLWAAMPESLIDPWQQLEFLRDWPAEREREVFYRCDRNGRTTFSDRPCNEGAMRIVIPRPS